MGLDPVVCLSIIGLAVLTQTHSGDLQSRTQPVTGDQGELGPAVAEPLACTGEAHTTDYNDDAGFNPKVLMKALPILAMVFLVVVFGVMSDFTFSYRHYELKKIDRVDNTGHTAIMRAISSGDLIEVRRLVEKGANIDVVDPQSGMTAFLLAAEQSLAMVQLIASVGTDLEQCDNQGRTALMLATLAGSQETVQYLIGLGAKVGATSKSGETAMHYANNIADDGFAELLFFAGATYVPESWVYYNNMYKDQMGMMYKVRTDGTGETMLNSQGREMTITEDGWIYFVNTNDNSSLWKVRKDGTGKVKLSEGAVSSITVVDDWIYYLVGDLSRATLHRIRTDGTDKARLGDDSAQLLNVVGNWVYYVNKSDGNTVYRIGTNGMGRTKLSNDIPVESSVIINGDWTYYINRSDAFALYKMRNDGTGTVKLTNSESYLYLVIDDWVFYTNVADDNCLYRIKTNGTGIIKLSSDTMYHPVAVDEWIFYINLKDDHTLYRIRTDGTGRAKVINEPLLWTSLGSYSVVDGWVYYINPSDDYSIYKIRTDGTSKAKLINKNFFAIWTFSVIGQPEQPPAELGSIIETDIGKSSDANSKEESPSGTTVTEKGFAWSEHHASSTAPADVNAWLAWLDPLKSIEFVVTKEFSDGTYIVVAPGDGKKEFEIISAQINSDLCVVAMSETSSTSDGSLQVFKVHSVGAGIDLDIQKGYLRRLDIPDNFRPLLYESNIKYPNPLGGIVVGTTGLAASPGHILVEGISISFEGEIKCEVLDVSGTVIARHNLIGGAYAWGHFSTEIPKAGVNEVRLFVESMVDGSRQNEVIIQFPN